MRAVSDTATLDGRPYVTQAYEGSVPGPMLVVCPGDRMIVNFENDLEETNLHTHGFHVSPRDNSDNIFLDIKPGEKFTYEFDIPKTIRSAHTGIIRTATAIRQDRFTRGWRGP